MRTRLLMCEDLLYRVKTVDMPPKGRVQAERVGLCALQRTPMPFAAEYGRFHPMVTNRKFIGSGCRFQRRWSGGSRFGDKS